MDEMQNIEAEYAEAFGLEAEDIAQESASEDTGAQTQETGESVSEGEETPAAEENPTTGEKPGEMPPEERARWASRRRAWEAREEAAAQARVDKVYADMFAGQANPYTGKPITTEAEYRAYQTEHTRRQQQEQLQKAGIDPMTIQGMVEQQMAPFRQQMEQARLSAIAERARSVNARAEAAISAEMQKISAMDPGVKTLEDIAAMPTAAKFNDYIQKGIGMEDAFYLANRKEIDGRRMAAARAATQTQMAGKGHLNPVSSGGKTPYQVTQAEIQAYRAFMPDATDAEIRAAYEAEHKN